MAREAPLEQLLVAMRAWDSLLFHGAAPDELVKTSPLLGAFGKVEVEAESELGHGRHLIK